VTKRGSIFCFGLGLYFLTGQVFLSQNGQRGSLLVCNWLHSIGQNHFHVMMLFIRDSVFFKSLPFRAMLLEDSAQIPSQKNWIPCIHLDDMIFRLDAQLSNHHWSRRWELSVRTFLSVKKLRTVPNCIRPDVSATHPDAVQCWTSYGISFQNTDMGRQLQLSKWCVFPFGCTLS
jgi:hypothetical protein